MVIVNLNGIKFNAADGEPSDFGCFTEGHPKGNDTGPVGMIAEMKAFIRVTEERKLRNFVDVGALFGVFSLVFTRHGDARALAIEPSTPAYEGLMQNVILNPLRQISPRQLFCGENTGTQVRAGCDWKHLVADRFLEREGSQTVTETAIDDLRIEAMDCMKIDVEGYECPVLRGAAKTLARFRPILFLECHLFTLTPKGETAEGLYSLLESYSYKICKLDDSPLESFHGHSMARVICYPR